MRPDDRELDEEIRGHLALSVRERIERGESPQAARLAALREFGYVPAIRDSMGVLSEGALIVAIGIVAGAAGGYAFAGVAASYLDNVRLPGALPILAAAAVLAGAVLLASLMPAARASRVDVLQALRSE